MHGKYQDVILRMTVLRRLDSLLEPTQQVLLDMNASLDKAGIVHEDQTLRQTAGHAEILALENEDRELLTKTLEG